MQPFEVDGSRRLANKCTFVTTTNIKSYKRKVFALHFFEGHKDVYFGHSW